MHDLRIVPEVEADVVNGFGWYEAKSPGLGDEFLRTFYAGAREIQRDPLLFQKVHKAVRRHLLRRFPYAVYFTIAGDVAIILGLFHCARDPRTVLSQLRRRDNPEH